MPWTPWARWTEQAGPGEPGAGGGGELGGRGLPLEGAHWAHGMGKPSRHSSRETAWSPGTSCLFVHLFV